MELFYPGGRHFLAAHGSVANIYQRRRKVRGSDTALGGGGGEFLILGAFLSTIQPLVIN